MRLLTKYHTLPKRKNANSHFQWFMVVMLGLFMGWVWWRNLQDPTPESASDQARKIQVTPVFRAKNSTNAAASITLARPAARPYSSEPAPGEHSARNIYELQIALARHGISSGSVDGVMGSQTRAALRAFQMKEGLPVTGEPDAATKAKLFVTGATERLYTITAEDVANLSPVGTTWLAKSVQDRLDYETILEAVAENGHAHPNLIRTLNPSVDWNRAGVGATVRIPDVEFPPVREKAALIRIHLGAKVLDVFDHATNLLAHFPCSIARQVGKRPVGKLQVEKIVLDPNYKFSPEIFPESEEGRRLKRALMIPPGPNNPVGAAWIGLNRRGYGIHGTPRPEEVGRTESHGCFRLANWNAQYLAQLVELGTPVYVEP